MFGITLCLNDFVSLKAFVALLSVCEGPSELCFGAASRTLEQEQKDLKARMLWALVHEYRQNIEEAEKAIDHKEDYKKQLANKMEDYHGRVCFILLLCNLGLLVDRLHGIVAPLASFGGFSDPLERKFRFCF